MAARFKTYEEFLSWTQSDKFTLSASSMAAFSTPNSFVQYFLKDRDSSKAMDEGSLIHCMVLEKEKLEKNFVMLPNEMILPSSKNQVDFINSILNNCGELRIIEESYKAAYTKYSVSDCLLLYKKLKPYITFLRGVGRRAIIKEDSWIDWQNVASKLLENESVMKALRNCTDFEYKIEFSYMGVNFKGFVDAWGYNETEDTLYIVDLKKRVTADPYKIIKEITYGDIGRQLALYSIGLSLELTSRGIVIDSMAQIKVGILSVDASCDTSVVWVTVPTLLKCIDNLEKKILRIKECVFFEDWNKSWDYNSADGFFYA